MTCETETHYNVYSFKGKVLEFRGYTGFPIKDARFSKGKTVSDLLGEDKEGNTNKNID